ncbi:MAG TPA: response regulator [Desulfuromonadaceae bacterium]|jgi:DNA-binding NtrC family response regulator
MQEGLLIVSEDKECRNQMARMFTDAGYKVTVSNSIASTLCGILKKTVQVVVLGTNFEEISAGEIIPLLKRCNKKLRIILMSPETPIGLLRKLRCEGIFYHALKPVDATGREEIRQAVSCAFENLRMNPA